MPDTLRGIGVSPGLAAGPVARMSPPPSLPERRAVADSEREVAVAADALRAAESRLRERAAAAAGAARDVLDAPSMIAADRPDQGRRGRAARPA
jgi:phosphotransferase system enzyme I (PtsI)